MEPWNGMTETLRLMIPRSGRICDDESFLFNLNAWLFFASNSASRIVLCTLSLCLLAIKFLWSRSTNFSSCRIFFENTCEPLALPNGVLSCFSRSVGRLLSSVGGYLFLFLLPPDPLFRLAPLWAWLSSFFFSFGGSGWSKLYCMTALISDSLGSM